jgi:hypothetical protein
MIIERPDFQRLAGDIAGQIILPEDADYEVARRVWNWMIDKRPLGIVRCVNNDDVLAAIAFAADNEIAVAVRGGGHNIAGNATCDKGLIIDLSAMKSIEVDRHNRRARAGGGVLWGEFDAETQKVGLATTGGLIPSTGIAGFTLGGGLGHLMRSYGLACDNLLSATVVTAAGRSLRTSSQENDDLFWAIRGGGGNFGIVTSFEFELHDVGPNLLGGQLIHRLNDAPDVLRFNREFMARAPDNLIVYAGLSTGPDGEPQLGLRPVFNGPVAEGQALLKPLRQFGTPVLDDIKPRPYVDIQKIVEPAFPPGRLNYWKANFVDDLSDELIDVLIAAYRRVPSRYSIIALEPMGGAIGRMPDTATAFHHRTSAYSLLILGGWLDDADSEANVAWVRELWDATRPLSSSAVYVNYLGTEGDSRIRDAYGPNHARLSELKRKYDPGNFFRLNQNIEPTANS